MNFKDAVSDTKSKLEALAEGAGTLENKNLRDILLRGAAKLGQALEHPDIDRVDEQGDEQEKLPFDAFKAATEASGDQSLPKMLRPLNPVPQFLSDGAPNPEYQG